MPNESSINNNNNTNIKIINKKDRSLNNNISKLRSILLRILNCSLIMELTFIISVVVSTFDGQTFNIMGNLTSQIDMLINVIFISLMLEHNNNNYYKLQNNINQIHKHFKHMCVKYFCWCGTSKRSFDNNTNKLNASIADHVITKHKMITCKITTTTQTNSI